MVYSCFICKREIESTNYLFISCPFAIAILQFVSQLFRGSLDLSSTPIHLLHAASQIVLGRHLFSLLLNVVVYGFCFIWITLAWKHQVEMNTIL